MRRFNCQELLNIVYHSTIPIEAMPLTYISILNFQRFDDSVGKDRLLTDRPPNDGRIHENKKTGVVTGYTVEIVAEISGQPPRSGRYPGGGTPRLFSGNHRNLYQNRSARFASGQCTDFDRSACRWGQPFLGPIRAVHLVEISVEAEVGDENSRL